MTSAKRWRMMSKHVLRFDLFLEKNADTQRKNISAWLVIRIIDRVEDVWVGTGDSCFLNVRNRDVGRMVAVSAYWSCMRMAQNYQPYRSLDLPLKLFFWVPCFAFHPCHAHISQYRKLPIISSPPVISSPVIELWHDGRLWHASSELQQWISVDQMFQPKTAETCLPMECTANRGRPSNPDRDELRVSCWILGSIFMATCN